MAGLVRASKSLQSSQQAFVNNLLGRCFQASSSYGHQNGLGEQLKEIQQGESQETSNLKILSKLNKPGSMENYMNKVYFSARPQTQSSVEKQQAVTQLDELAKNTESKSLGEQLKGFIDNPKFKALLSLSPLGMVAGKAWCDVPERWQIGLQDPATTYMQNCIDIHMETLTLIWFMSLCNYYLLIRFFVRGGQPLDQPGFKTRVYDHPMAETIWTLTPVISVTFLAVSAFGLIYSDEVLMGQDSYTGLTVKVIGRQWYWTYNYPPFMEDFDGDSYRIPDDDLEDGQFRLLDVDNRMVLPTNTPIRLIITASDVLHSWAVPSFGIKCDAVPGRLNMVNTLIKRPGIFYGQCSELCGVQHFGMPICVVALPPDDDLWH